jgi:indolepyruvate ferredoxin oxidoreductase
VEIQQAGGLAARLTIHHRDELITVQQDFAKIRAAVLIYDRTCAEARRQARTFPDPDKRVVINRLVCEGCGDCGVKSTASRCSRSRPNGAASAPSTSRAATRTFLREGLLPSFVTVHGGKLKQGTGVASSRPVPLPERSRRSGRPMTSS